MTLTLVSFVGCYSAFELEVETVKGEMVTRLSSRAPISLLNGSSVTAIGYSGMADIEVKVQGKVWRWAIIGLICTFRPDQY